MFFKNQKEFPFLEDFKKFPITKDTIFVYKDTIYANGELPPDILLHEQEHIKQQKRIGADIWIKKYLNDSVFRTEQEIEAYRCQLNSIKDREFKNIVRMEAAKNLSSGLYGEIISYKTALRNLG